MKNLPLGINTLSSMRSYDMVYVDKTKLALNLVSLPGRFFLSRPRRFGKSLFIDTLKEIFEGNKDLFEGLYIHDKWDWNKKFPVIKIDFADGTLKSRAELNERILDILRKNAEQLNVGYDSTDIPGKFGDIIRNSATKYGQPAVVLVDEYDKPILDNMENPAVAAEMREALKNLYSVLKGQDAHLQFIFMTGVSKFSKVSLFSGINQLTDITIDAKYSSICGYTDNDLRTSFAEHLEGCDLEKIRQWYNGYGWTGTETVYNPYDILLFINQDRVFRNYWFETGSPSFLIKLFQKNRYFLPNLENLEVTEEILDSFDVERINPLTLLFQTGYLTIDHTFTRRDRLIFALKIPNFEVKTALTDQFINAYTEMDNEKLGIQDQLYQLLEQGNIDGLINVIKRLFASVPYRNFTNNNLPDCEGYYASVLYAYFVSLNARIVPEDITNHGQTDMTVLLGNHVYVMEIKLVDDAEINGNPALDQIRNKGYAKKYQGKPNITIHELGLIFSRKERNLVKADWMEPVP